MNNVLQEKIVEIMDLGQIGILKALSIIKIQAPSLIQEFLNFKIFDAVFGIFIGIIALFIAKSCLKYMKKEEWNYNNGFVVLSLVLTIFASFFGVIFILVDIHSLFKIILAPNVYILENLLTFLNSCN